MKPNRINLAALRFPLVAAAMMLAACGGSHPAGSATPQASAAIELKVLSNRADMITGGDVLVEVVATGSSLAKALPQLAKAVPQTVRMELNGLNVSNQVRLRGNGRIMGVVSGLRLGANTLRATLPSGEGSQITITNYPRGGPVFSGPQIQPWQCSTDLHGLGAAQDAQCNGETIHFLRYRNNNGTFADYDPENPPSDVASTTTDEGLTVPYIVLRERGTTNRGIYDIAVLVDPDQPWEPWQVQEQWNEKFVYSFGQGCNPGYLQQPPQDPELHEFLSRGYAVGVASTTVFGRSCNHITAAETVMMIKERVVESLGPIRFTIGDDCSGAAEAQNTIAENYPGLLDGIRPECTFADGWSPGIFSKNDCLLLETYFGNADAALAWGPANSAARTAVLGVPDQACANSGASVFNPSASCSHIEDQALLYHPQDNPTGVRCTVQDYNINALGARPADGFANVVIDYVGVQWGLAALQAGTITVDQFVDLNVNVGSFNHDYELVPERTSADVEGVTNMYRTGQLTYARNLAKIPTLDSRGTWNGDLHLDVYRDMVRARQLRSNGNVDTQVYWSENVVFPFGSTSPLLQELTLEVMSEWLTNIENDSRDIAPELKVAENRPDAARDGCYSSEGARISDDVTCAGLHQSLPLPRMVAGMPLTGDVLKCQLKPLDFADADYSGISFSGAQQTALAATFPDGVCDWTLPGVGFQPPLGDWLDFSAGPGGVPAGPAPKATAF